MQIRMYNILVLIVDIDIDIDIVITLNNAQRLLLTTGLIPVIKSPQ